MGHVIEADEQGTVHLSSDVTGARPHKTFRVEVQPGTVVLRLLISYPRNWDKTTPAQRAADLMEMFHFVRYPSIMAVNPTSVAPPP